MLNREVTVRNENAPSAVSERFDRIGKCLSDLWDTIKFSRQA